MSLLGTYLSSLGMKLVCDSAFDEEAAGFNTTSGTLVDITNLTFDLVVPVGLPSTATIFAVMTFQAYTGGVGSPTTGAWAISINAVDQTEVQRYLSGTNDAGIGAVMGSVGSLSNGTYTVKGRSRVVSGAGTLYTSPAQLFAVAVLI